jgi:hypothetical protein
VRVSARQRSDVKDGRTCASVSERRRHVSARERLLSGVIMTQENVSLFHSQKIIRFFTGKINIL